MITVNAEWLMNIQWSMTRFPKRTKWNHVGLLFKYFIRNNQSKTFTLFGSVSFQFFEPFQVYLSLTTLVLRSGLDRPKIQRRKLVE